MSQPIKIVNKKEQLLKELNEVHDPLSELAVKAKYATKIRAMKRGDPDYEAMQRKWLYKAKMSASQLDIDEMMKTGKKVHNVYLDSKGMPIKEATDPDIDKSVMECPIQLDTSFQQNMLHKV